MCQIVIFEYFPGLSGWGDFVFSQGSLGSQFSSTRWLSQSQPHFQTTCVQSLCAFFFVGPTLGGVPTTPDPNTSAKVSIAIQMGGVSRYKLVYIRLSAKRAHCASTRCILCAQCFQNATLGTSLVLCILFTVFRSSYPAEARKEIFCQRCREIWREILVRFSVLRFPGFGCARENVTKISCQKRCEKKNGKFHGAALTVFQSSGGHASATGALFRAGVFALPLSVPTIPLAQRTLSY